MAPQYLYKFFEGDFDNLRGFFIGVGRFRILGGGGARFRILGGQGLEYWGGGAKGGQIPSRHMTS